jgi:hypothetical protein
VQGEEGWCKGEILQQERAEILQWLKMHEQGDTRDWAMKK